MTAPLRFLMVGIATCLPSIPIASQSEPTPTGGKCFYTFELGPYDTRLVGSSRVGQFSRSSARYVAMKKYRDGVSEEWPEEVAAFFAEQIRIGMKKWQGPDGKTYYVRRDKPRENDPKYQPRHKAKAIDIDDDGEPELVVWVAVVKKPGSWDVSEWSAWFVCEFTDDAVDIHLIFTRMPYGRAAHVFVESFLVDGMRVIVFEEYQYSQGEWGDEHKRVRLYFLRCNGEYRHLLRFPTWWVSKGWAKEESVGSSVELRTVVRRGDGNRKITVDLERWDSAMRSHEDYGKSAAVGKPTGKGTETYEWNGRRYVRTSTQGAERLYGGILKFMAARYH